MTFEEFLQSPRAAAGRGTMLRVEALMAAYESGAAAEREECAVLCEDRANATVPEDFALDALRYAAAAIRARGA